MERHFHLEYPDPYFTSIQGNKVMWSDHQLHKPDILTERYYNDNILTSKVSSQDFSCLREADSKCHNEWDREEPRPLLDNIKVRKKHEVVGKRHSASDHNLTANYRLGAAWSVDKFNEELHRKEGLDGPRALTVDKTIMSTPALCEEVHLAKQENHFIKEPLYSCHLQKAEMFPHSRGEYEIGRLPNELRQRQELSDNTLRALDEVVHQRFHTTNYQREYCQATPDYHVPKIDETTESPSERTQANVEECVKEDSATPHRHQGLRPSWPTSTNSLPSPFTGQIVEKLQVKSFIDDPRDYRPLKLQAKKIVQEKEEEEAMKDDEESKKKPEPCAFSVPLNAHKLLGHIPNTHKHDEGIPVPSGVRTHVPVHHEILSTKGRTYEEKENTYNEHFALPAAHYLPRPTARSVTTVDPSVRAPFEEYRTPPCKLRHKNNDVLQYRSGLQDDMLSELRVKSLGRRICDTRQGPGERPQFENAEKRQLIAMSQQRPRTANSLQCVRSENVLPQRRAQTALSGPRLAAKTPSAVRFHDQETGRVWEDSSARSDDDPNEIAQAESDEKQDFSEDPSQDQLEDIDDRDECKVTGWKRPRSGTYFVQEFPSQSVVQSELPNERQQIDLQILNKIPLPTRMKEKPVIQTKAGGWQCGKQRYIKNYRIDRSSFDYETLIGPHTAALQRLTERGKRLQYRPKPALRPTYGEIKYKPAPLWESLDYDGDRVPDRLGVRFRTVATKRYHQHHPEPVPDPRVWRTSPRKNMFYGFHSHVFG